MYANFIFNFLDIPEFPAIHVTFLLKERFHAKEVNDLKVKLYGNKNESEFFYFSSTYMEMQYLPLNST